MSYYAETERVWLKALEDESANAGTNEKLLADKGRALAPEELIAVIDYLKSIDEYFAGYLETAGELSAAGRPLLSRRVKEVRAGLAQRIEHYQESAGRLRVAPAPKTPAPAPPPPAPVVEAPPPRPVLAPVLAQTDAPRRRRWTMVAAAIILLPVFAAVGYPWLKQQTALASIENRDYRSVSYNDPVFANCLGVATCLERKQHAAELSSIADWDQVPADSPLLKDCMRLPSCVSAADEVKTILATDYTMQPRTHPRRQRCRGYQPCLTVFPQEVLTARTAQKKMGNSAADGAITDPYAPGPERSRPQANNDGSPAPLGNEKLYQINK